MTNNEPTKRRGCSHQRYNQRNRVQQAHRNKAGARISEPWFTSNGNNAPIQCRHSLMSNSANGISVSKRHIFIRGNQS
jgi:hypothetical protein